MSGLTALRALELDAEKRRRCPNCSVEPEKTHDLLCDVARCTKTGRQHLTCDGRHVCEPDVWTGEWPGLSDVRRLGLGSLNDLGAPGFRWSRSRRRWERVGESRGKR